MAVSVIGMSAFTHCGRCALVRLGFYYDDMYDAIVYASINPGSELERDDRAEHRFQSACFVKVVEA